MENFLELLNTAFIAEYEDVFLYLRESSIFKKKIAGGEKLAEIFEDFSVMELKHADLLAMKLIKLGGRPTWQFRQIDDSASLKDTLQRHVISESRLYKIYTDLIDACADRNFKIVLKGIRDNEKEHLEKVTYLLKK